MYLGALKKELMARAQGQYVRSIYLGGGTPSLLSAGDIGDLLSLIRAHFKLDKAAEISIEANPGTVDEAYLTTIRKISINRLSLGVQSFNDRELAMLGRIHTAAEARDAVRLARNSGFDNLNLDFIYGLPGQTLAGWKQTLDDALALYPEHLSLYALTLEEDTPMWKAIKGGSLPESDTDLSADQYELAEDLLAAHAFGHYEISNWARPGRECRHNLHYWQNLPYIGIGAAAHSCMNGHRFANYKSLDKYISSYSRGTSPRLPEMNEEITPELELAETAILGLRLREGINVDYLQKRFNVDVLAHYHRQVEEMSGAGLLERADKNIKLTRRGRLLSNEVFWRLLPE